MRLAIGTRMTVTLIGVIFAALGAATSAQAAVTIGQTAGAQDSCGSNQIMVQASVAGAPSYSAPFRGVIVSWSYLAHASTPNIRLKVYDSTADPAKWFLRSQSAEHTGGPGSGQVNPNKLNTFAESPGIPIQAGDRLGLTGSGGVPIACVDTNSTSDRIRVKAPPDTTVGVVNEGFIGDNPKLKLGVSAVVEPDADGDGFGDESQDSCRTDSSVHTGACPVDVSIVKSASANPRVGSNLTYGLVVKNNHAVNPASGVSVTDVLPAGTTFVASAAGQGSCTGTTTVTCALGTLAPDQSVNVAIVVRPSATGPLINTAGVSTTASDGNGSNNASTASVTVGPAIPLLSAFKLKPGTFVAAASGPSVVAAAATGAIISYKLNAPATTKFTVQKREPGVRKGKKCVAPPRNPPGTKPKKCTRYLTRGSFTHRDSAGSARFRFTGRVKGKALRPGSYRLRAVARNASGASKPATKTFKIKKG